MNQATHEREVPAPEVVNMVDQLPSICRGRGAPVPASDSLVAACAFSRGATIDTEDKHFATLETCRVITKN